MRHLFDLVLVAHTLLSQVQGAVRKKTVAGRFLLDDGGKQFIDFDVDDFDSGVTGGLDLGDSSVLLDQKVHLLQF